MRDASSFDAEDIAVIGYAARLPGADGVRDVWKTLIEGRCNVEPIPDDRWSTVRYFDPNRETLGKSYAKNAGLLDRVFDFDAGYFGLSPREAEQMDPQQRILLETVARSFDHAGIDPSKLEKQRTGVFIGAASSDHSTTCLQDPSMIDAQFMLGNTLSIISNRISYHWDIQGPSYTVDTACSSGLFALDQARRAIASGEIDTAIVGSVNVLLSPMPFIGFSKASMLSATGLCQAFGSGADGYVRAEGAVVFVLRKASLARASHDRIRSYLAATGTNSDGRTAGIAMPSSARQLELLEQVKDRFGIEPEDLAFVEAHGTGTLVGDPEEARAIGTAYGQPRSEPLPIGSAKTNFGHLEPAAGLVGLLKAQLALEHGVLPASLHADELNPHIPFDELGLEVAREVRPLPERDTPWSAAVNSFGFGGANAHAVLRQAAGRPQPEVEVPQALILTAESQVSLRELATSWLHKAEADQGDLARQISNANTRIARHRHRLCVPAGSKEKLKANLEGWLKGTSKAAAIEGTAKYKHDAKVGFVFSGNGSQWAGMGRYMLLNDVTFRDRFGALNEMAVEYGSESLLDLIMSPELDKRLDRAPVAQPLLLAVQIALVDALAAKGLEPAAVLGHSAGEVAAAYACGAITMEEAVRIIVARSATLDQLYSRGTMAALVCDVQTAENLITDAGLDVDIAAENSAQSLTVSGNSEDVTHLLKLCRKKRIVGKRLQIEYPYHSQQTDPLHPRLIEELEGIEGRKTDIAFYSGCMGGLVSGDTLDPEFWWANARNRVRFRDGIAAMAADGVQMFVEISPRSVLLSYVRDCLSEEGQGGTALGSLEQSNAERIDASTVALSVLAHGGQLDEDELLGAPVPFEGGLPDYPFDRKEHRMATTKQLDLFGRKQHHPLLGSRVAPDSNVWTSDLSISRLPWLADHKVDGRVLVPATAILELFLSAASDLNGEGPVELRNLEILRPIQIGDTDSVPIRVSHDAVARRLTLETRIGDEWVWTAGAALFQTEAEAPSNIDLADGEVRQGFYTSLSGLGLDYGKAFARAEKVSVDGTVADVQLAPTVIEDAAFKLDPTASDAALHALLPMLDQYKARGQFVFVPGRMGRVRWFAQGTVTGARLTLKSGSVAGVCVDVTYLDAEGQVLAVVEELRLRPMPLGRDRRAMYWDERSIPVSTTTSELLIASQIAEHSDADEPPSDLQVLRDTIGSRLAWDIVAEAGDGTSLDRRYDAAFSALESMELVRLNDDGEIQFDGECPWPSMAMLLRLLIETEPDAADEIQATLHGMVSEGRNDARGIDRATSAALALLDDMPDTAPRALMLGRIEPIVFRRLLSKSEYLVVAVEHEDEAEALRLNLEGADRCLIATVDAVSNLPGFDLVVSLVGAEALSPRLQRNLAKFGTKGGRLLTFDYAVDLFEIMTGRYGDADALRELDANLAQTHVEGSRETWVDAPNVSYLTAGVRKASIVPQGTKVEIRGVGAFAESLQSVVQEGEAGGISLIALDPDGAAGDRVLAQSEAFRDLPANAKVIWMAQQGLEAEASLRGWRRVLANETGRDIRCISVDETVDPAEVMHLVATSNERELSVTTAGVYTQRVTPAQDGDIRVGPDQKAVLAQAAHGRLETLQWSVAARQEPKNDEVEVQVEATALNFRDVMWAQGLLPSDLLEGGFAGPSLGMECSGVVSRAGSGTGLVEGQRVLAFSRDAFSSHVTVPSEAVVPIPDELELAAAAAIPVIFVTAEYALSDLARLRPGDWCLIHGGAGGVGLAAIQVAQRADARIIATAGSEEKRTLLRSLGVEHVCDSRSLEFPNFVEELTCGRGVDVVLNSLAGEAMEQGIGCLAPFGRFIELGKRDFVANTAIGLRALKNNVSYFAVDADQLLGHRPEIIADIMGRVIEAFTTGDYFLPPVRVSPAERVGDAFRLMQRSGHIGKILVAPPDVTETETTEAPGFDGNWLITGGTRGFGLATAEWLAERGASQLWLVSRSGQVEDQERINALIAKGIRVETCAVDLVDEADVGTLMQEIADAGGLTGIVNAAAVFDDTIFAEADAEGLSRVIDAKVKSAHNLDRASRDFDLDHFWLYSSVASRFGNPGQSAYVAANLELEALAERRAAEGLPGLAVAWGPIGDVGYLDRSDGVKEIIERKLGRTMQSAEALNALERILETSPDRSTVTVAPVDWSRLKGDVPVVSEPLFEFLDLRSDASGGDGAIDLPALIASQGEAKTRLMLIDILRREAAQIMRIAPSEIDVDRELVDLGFDSLMGMNLKMAMEERLGSATPLTSVADGMTLSRLAHAIVSSAIDGTSETVEGTMAERHLTESDLPTETIAKITDAAAGQN